MKILLSPAKNLNQYAPKLKGCTEPLLINEAKKLVDILRGKKTPYFKKLMNISDDLAKLNAERYQNFTFPHNQDNSHPAIYLFNGTVYTGLDIESFDKNDLECAQSMIRIISGLYGVLRPLDLIQPYRLEMGTKLKSKYSGNLYQFWQEKISIALNDELQTQRDSNQRQIVNLASREYLKAIKPKLLDADIITPTFKDKRKGRYISIMQFVKTARGKITKHIIKSKIKNIDEIKNYNEDDYCYNEELSKGNNYVFTRE